MYSLLQGVLSHSGFLKSLLFRLWKLLKKICHVNLIGKKSSRAIKDGQNNIACLIINIVLLLNAYLIINNTVFQNCKSIDYKVNCNVVGETELN